MLLLVEHDHLLRTKAARECLVAFLIGWTGDELTVVIFRSTRKHAIRTERLYPSLIRHRLVITPATPRESNLPYWLNYELCCTRTALRYAGTLAAEEPWLAVVPPAWVPAMRRRLRARQILALDHEFNPGSVPWLQAAIEAQRHRAGGASKLRRPGVRLSRERRSSELARPASRSVGLSAHS
jgi:hypothetical protein